MQQLTMLLLLLVWLQIYCNSVVLSLPPSLIASAASGLRLQLNARQQQQQQQHQQQQKAKEQWQSGIPSLSSSFSSLWKKDKNSNFYDSLAVHGAATDNIRGSNNNHNANNNNNILTKIHLIPPSAIASNHDDIADDSLDPKSTALLLPSSSSSQQSPTPPVISQKIRDIEWNKFLTPFKYWARQCQPNVDENCPRDNQQFQFQQQHQTAPLRIADNRNKATSALSDDDSDSDDIDTSLYPNKDIFMLLNGQEDLMKFLHWSMDQLHPNEGFKNFSLGNGDNIYTTDKHWWRKLNLSGRIEPPLFVDEPHYVIVRREPLNEGNWDYLYKNDPFIPPRGRKHNLVELEQLLHRYEPFVPNRGKRDKIKDIFKYDDLFFPNRGKKEKPPTDADAFPFENDERQNVSPTFNADDFKSSVENAGDDENIVEDDDVLDYQINRNKNDADKWTLPPPPLQQATSPLAEMTATLRPSKLLQQKAAAIAAAIVDGKPSLAVNINGGGQQHTDSSNNQEYDNSNNNKLIADDWPQRMSTNVVKINGYDQSVKTSMPTIAAAARTTTKLQQPQQQQQQWLKRIFNADGVAANRLHATRSMSTMRQQRNLLMAAAKEWLKSTMFSMPLRHQLLEKLKQHQLQLKNHQHQNEAAARAALRNQQLLQRNAAAAEATGGGRQLPQETQLAALDMQQESQEQRQHSPTTFIDGNDDYNYF